MVLQQAPLKACVYGEMGNGGVSVNLSLKPDDDEQSYLTQTVVATTEGMGGGWSACFNQAMPAGGSYTITASCHGCTNGTVATLNNVTFGDVWYCGGQSNMALPLLHTDSRNISRDAILAGKYSNIRIHGMSGNMNPTQPWTTLKNALNNTADNSERSKLMMFSSTCYYYGESLADELAKAGNPNTPIGLIHTAFGGSTIEQWLTNESIATCSDVPLSSANQEWHDQRVMPYSHMTVKGWVWYQGENDMHNMFGNQLRHSGYACLMPTLVSQWRSIWSATSGTDPMAPFGLVTLAPSGTEGGSDIGTMRWAQTGNYGTLPNPVMPNTFIAQAFDLNDQWSNDSCYGKVHCPSLPENASNPWGQCAGYCESVAVTNWYMGPIHPRDKKPVGLRLAQAASVIAYANKGWSNGPTLSGCSMADNKITVKFNMTMLSEGGSVDKVKVQPYNMKTGASKMFVLTNASAFCMQAAGRGECRDDGKGHNFTEGSTTNDWVAVDIAEGANPNEIIVDLAKTNGTAYAIAYGWTGDCCSENAPTSGPCPLASCPLMGSMSNLPPNPFIALVEMNRCKCIEPQVCDE